MNDIIPQGSLWGFRSPFSYSSHHENKPIVFWDAYLTKTESATRCAGGNIEGYVTVSYMTLGDEDFQEFRYCEIPMPASLDAARYSFLGIWHQEWYRIDDHELERQEILQVEGRPAIAGDSQTTGPFQETPHPREAARQVAGLRR